MSTGNLSLPASRRYVIQVVQPGRLPYLPALLAEIGIAPGDVPRRAHAQSLMVRVRPRNAEGVAAIEQLHGALGPANMGIPHAAGGVWTLTCERRALEAGASDLRSSSEPSQSSLGNELLDALRNTTEPLPYATRIGAHTFHWGQRTHVMGIINVTPDSFSGDGIMARTGHGSSLLDSAVEQAVRFQQLGADMLDIGAESTRPGAEPLPEAQELERLIPVVAAVRRETTIPLSVDTYKAAVARAALAEGADVINDVWGLRADPGMGAVVMEHDSPVILMHNRSRQQPATSAALGPRYVGVRYTDLVLDILEALGDIVDAAREHRVDRRHMIVDPGLGFGKTVNQNLRLLQQADALRVLGQPILLGPSRKSFVGYTLGAPADQRVHGTMAAIAVAIACGGADIVRVHDVQAAVQTAALADAIRGAAAPFHGAGGD